MEPITYFITTTQVAIAYAYHAAFKRSLSPGASNVGLVRPEVSEGSGSPCIGISQRSCLCSCVGCHGRSPVELLILLSCLVASTLFCAKHHAFRVRRYLSEHFAGNKKDAVIQVGSHTSLPATPAHIFSVRCSHQLFSFGALFHTKASRFSFIFLRVRVRRFLASPRTNFLKLFCLQALRL